MKSKQKKERIMFQVKSHQTGLNRRVSSVLATHQTQQEALEHTQARVLRVGLEGSVKRGWGEDHEPAARTAPGATQGLRAGERQRINTPDEGSVVSPLRRAAGGPLTTRPALLFNHPTKPAGLGATHLKPTKKSFLHQVPLMRFQKTGFTIWPKT